LSRRTCQGDKAYLDRPCLSQFRYIAYEDAFFTCGYLPEKPEEAGIYIFRVGENAWYRVDIAPPPGKKMRGVVGQNRAIIYDPKHNLVLMVLGELSSGGLDNAAVHALRYNPKKALAAN